MLDWDALPADLIDEFEQAACRQPAIAHFARFAHLARFGGTSGGAKPAGGDTATGLRHQADRCIEEAVRLCDGNLSAAARRLGISRNTLYRRLRAMHGHGR